MSITKSGTVTLAVNVGGTTLVQTAHVRVKYQCPPFFPTQFVPDVGEKAVQARMNEGGIPIGTHTVWIQGPWTLVQDFGYVPEIGLAKGRYRPSRASNDLGNTYFLASSWVEFTCATRIKDYDDEGHPNYAGLMHYNLHLDIYWTSPPAP